MVFHVELVLQQPAIPPLDLVGFADIPSHHRLRHRTFHRQKPRRLPPKFVRHRSTVGRNLEADDHYWQQPQHDTHMTLPHDDGQRKPLVVDAALRRSVGPQVPSQLSPAHAPAEQLFLASGPHRPLAQKPVAHATATHPLSDLTPVTRTTKRLPPPAPIR